jgi:phosphoribosylformylglycinamidine cyclo-ligase
MTQQPRVPQAYAEAGGDVDAAEKLVGRFARLAESARRPEVLADIGPFAGLFKLGTRYRDPVLVSSTDSVGTKVKIAGLLDSYRSVGHDLVNHCVNDILTAGANPLFFLDYIGNTGLTDDAKAGLVEGCVEACRAAGCALLGGETADMPGTYAEGDFDLVGFIVGVVESDALIDGSAIAAGDILIGLPSSGMHTNGYSLARRLFRVGIDEDSGAERARLSENYAGLEGTLGEALLAPHRPYLEEVRRARKRAAVNGIAHVTGGGIPGNVPRILPEGLGARIDTSSWRVPALFRLIQETGAIDEQEMFRTFNMGLGLVLAVPPKDAPAVLDELRDAWVCGEVVPGDGITWS